MSDHRAPSAAVHLFAWGCAAWAVIATILVAHEIPGLAMHAPVVVSLWLAVCAAAVAWGVLGFRRSKLRAPAARVLMALACGVIGAALLLALMLLAYSGSGRAYGS